MKFKSHQISLFLLTLLLTSIISLTAVDIEEDEKIGSSKPVLGYFSPLIRTETITFREGVYRYKLGSDNIIVNSGQVSQEGTVYLSGEDYYLDYQGGYILFDRTLADSLAQAGQYVEIEYTIIPENLMKRFQLFVSTDYVDTLSVKRLPSSGVRFAFPETDLNISGSKTFGVSIGSDEDFSINQSLFLRIDGELRRNLYIQAQLSDSQSPLTPEGDTKELSSLDQIFIRLYGRTSGRPIRNEEHNEYEIVFGDLEMSFSDTYFMNHWSKFEGVKVEWRGRDSFKGALALSKGKQSTYDFRGQDGKQGPYYIRLPNVGTFVRIIPGSEEVFLNGLTLSRGTDYRIDYNEGSITFTQRHFIDSNSRIYVRFQYSDEDYRQFKYLTGLRTRLTDRLSTGFHMIVQSDDYSNPLQDILSDEDRRVLREAGDGDAWADGVVEVEMGAGIYIKVTEDDETFYRYAGQNLGNYIITFSYVGIGEGDYEQTAPGKFEYKGIGEGSWIPQRRLAAPQYKANYDVSVQWQGDNWQVDGEGLYSRYDRNTISELDSKDNDGYAAHWQLRLTPEFDKINPDLRLYYRYLSYYLNTFTDISDPEMQYDLYRIADIDSTSSTEMGSILNLQRERIWQANIRYFRREGKTDTRHITYNNDNLNLNLFWQPRTYLPSFNYRYRYYDHRVKTQDFQEDTNTSTSKHSTLQHNHISIGQTVSILRLGLDAQRRELTENTMFQDPDEDKMTGVRNTSAKLNFGSYGTRRVAANLFVGKDEDEVLNDDWIRNRESINFGGEAFVDVYDQNLRTSYSHRRITIHPDKIESFYDMAEINLNSSILNRGISTISNYSLVNTEFYPRIRELIYVGKDMGLYDSTGVFSEEGEYDFVSVPVGEPEMSIELNADFNLYFTPRLFLKEDAETANGSSSYLKEGLRRIQTESYFLIAENSRSQDKWDVYLLKPSLLMSEDNTIYGRQMNRQTLWLDLLPRRILTKLMYQRDKSLDNRYSEDVRTDVRLNELMLRLSRFINTDFELTYENRTEEESRYHSEVFSNSYSLDIRNRINNDLNLSTLLRYTSEEGDREGGGYDYQMQSYSIVETVSYFFQRKYRLFGRIEYRYNIRDGSGFLAFLPDKREGSIFRWSSRLNYQLNTYTTASFEYSGNKYPLQKSVHKMKIEVRAEF